MRREGEAATTVVPSTDRGAMRQGGRTSSIRETVLPFLVQLAMAVAILGLLIYSTTMDFEEGDDPEGRRGVGFAAPVLDWPGEDEISFASSRSCPLVRCFEPNQILAAGKINSRSESQIRIRSISSRVISSPVRS